MELFSHALIFVGLIFVIFILPYIIGYIATRITVRFKYESKYIVGIVLMGCFLSVICGLVLLWILSGLFAIGLGVY